MYKFKVGDKVRKLYSKYGYESVRVGGIYTVSHVGWALIRFAGYEGVYIPSHFELVEEGSNCGFTKDE